MESITIPLKTYVDIPIDELIGKLQEAKERGANHISFKQELNYGEMDSWLESQNKRFDDLVSLHEENMRKSGFSPV
jgi:hypothetical protein